MNFVKLTSLKKARIVLLTNALILFIFIIFTPYFIRVGFWGFPEWLIEAIFLAVEISVLIKLFRNYDRHSRKVEQKISKLDDELKEQQKILVDSLEYLGKMNVQMNIVKKVMSKLKFPVDNDRLEYILNEMAEVLISLSGLKGVLLRMVDLGSKKTKKEINSPELGKIQKFSKNISNHDLCRENNNYERRFPEFLVVASNYDNFSLKTFAIFPLGTKKKKELDKEKLELIQGIVNQCEVVYLLFNSKYYKKHEKTKYN